MTDMLDAPVAHPEMLVRVKSRGSVKTPFCAGMIYDTNQDKVVRAAPILKHLIGSNAARIRELQHANGWTVTIVRIGE